MNIFNPSRNRLINEFETLQQTYQQASPVPHLTIDRLFDPKILLTILPDFALDHDCQTTNCKQFPDFKIKSWTVARLSDHTRTFYFWLNSPDFIRAMTLVVNKPKDSLLGDPTFYGAGLHEILPGGQVKSYQGRIVHCCLPLKCQFNLITCLSPVDSQDFPGKIEIFSAQQKHSQVTYSLKFNRTFILPIIHQAQYRIINHGSDRQSLKLLSIYYWSLESKSV